MKTLIITGFVLICWALLSQNLIAQSDPIFLIQSDSIARITLLDGSVFQGRIIKQTIQVTSLETESIGTIDIPSEKIASIEFLDSERFREGEYWFENPNSTRYLFSPTGIPLKKGEGYYQNTYVILQSFNYGITNNISIGGGFDVITPFVRETPVFFFLSPKLGFKVAEKLHIGGGILYVNTSSFDLESLLIGYGVFTYGNTDNNITAGLGWGFVDGESNSKPIITISGMTRVSRRFGLVSENWFIPTETYYGVLSYGMRFISEKITVDFAFLNNRDIFEAIIIGIPYLDFVVKF
ncbi:MAG TPA: hypothetical protein ENI20_10320 [Bacteroides sp.]|nr:hypothetical protein [Bacteroides sp.]